MLPNRSYGVCKGWVSVPIKNAVNLIESAIVGRAFCGVTIDRNRRRLTLFTCYLDDRPS
jgi:hypothetical protein